MKKYGNEKGFTLIGFMRIVVIIGILSVIAIPNFISYRNKAYCSVTESDARNIAAAAIDYFAVPRHAGVPALLATIEAKNANLMKALSSGYGTEVEDVPHIKKLQRILTEKVYGEFNIMRSLWYKN
jgi:Tfp pilus assembly protein PilE